MADRRDRSAGSPIMLGTPSAVFAGEHWREKTSSLFNNLPVPPTSLIGRDAERVQAANILRQAGSRLLTLYGPGGVGKTRLALAVAADLASDFRDGIFFIPLANITDEGLLPSAIAQTLDLYTLPGEGVLPTLTGYMGGMEALFVLDNFEQLVAAAPVLSELLASCPRLRLLVTSRSVLNLRGEQQMQVQPLDTQAEGGSKTKDSIAKSKEVAKIPAVELFAQCARSVKPGFTLNSKNAETIAQICARLDGLPLAIELAAARIKLLSPEAILARLEKRLQLLVGGAQDLPVRHQTLRNTVEWSYELLSPREQRLFRLLSVFSGGCTVEALEAVSEAAGVADKGEALDIATSLANKSLLRVVDASDEEVRLAMLETVREYAAEHLRLSGEEKDAKDALVDYYVNLSEEAELELRGPEQVQWLDMLEREMPNLRGALDWCVSRDPEDGEEERLEKGLLIVGALSRFWQARSRLQEIMDRLEVLLERTTHKRNEARERALRTFGRILYNLGHYKQARKCYEEAIGIASARGDREAVTFALVGLANVEYDEGNAEAALHDYEECLAIWLELKHKPGLAAVYNNMGLIYANSDLSKGIEYLEKSIKIYRELGDKERIGIGLDSLGRTYARLNKLDLAEKYVREGLDLNLEIGDPWNIAYELVSLAQIACRRGQYREAAIKLATANATYDNFYKRLEDSDQGFYSACLESVQQALGSDFNAIWVEGTRLTPEEAIARVDQVETAKAAPEPIAKAQASALPDNSVGLSARELEVLALLSQGLPNAEVAERLFLSLYTVNAHLRNIYSKLNVSSRSAAMRYALEHSLI